MSQKRSSNTALIIPDGRTRIYDKYKSEETGKSKFEKIPLPAKDVFIGKMSSLCRQYAEKYYKSHWFILTTNNRKSQDFLVSPDEEIEGWYDNPPYPIPRVLNEKTGKPKYWQPFSDGGIEKIRKKAEELEIFGNYSRIIFLGNSKETDNTWWQQESWDNFIRKKWGTLSEARRADKDLEIFKPAKREFEYSLYTNVIRNVFLNDEPWLEFPLIDYATTPQMMSRISDAIYRDFPLHQSPFSLAKGTIENLFRMENPYFTYQDIPLGNRRYVQIITAPNGFGKSTLFRLIRAVFAGNIREIANVPFKKLVLTLNNNLNNGISRERILTIEKPDRKKKRRSKEIEPAIIFSLEDGKQKEPEKIFDEDLGKECTDSDWEIYKKDMGKRLGKIIPPLSIRYLPADRLWHDTLKSIKKYDLLSDIDNWESPYRSEFEALLQTGPPLKSDTSLIEQYAKSMEKRIEGILTDFATISHEIDTKFPLVYLKELSQKNVRKNFIELKNGFGVLDEQRESLEKIDLLPFRRWYRQKSGDEKEEVDPFISNDEKSLYPDFMKFLDIYIAKQKEKYEIFDWMKERCNLFEKTINNLLIFTRVNVQKDGGLSFYNYYQSKDESSVSSYHSLTPRQISSGEMHQIVMYYDSLFNCDPKTTILIDEPEISMHIAWQEQFIDNILKIAEMNNINFLIATHSTDIIGENWGITHDLLGGSYS